MGVPNKHDELGEPFMTSITFYFDFISPYAHLAFEELPKHLMGISHRVVYQPIVFGAVLKHHGHMGPAEIPGKREWTYRQDRKSTRLNSSHSQQSRMPSSA